MATSAVRKPKRQAVAALEAAAAVFSSRGYDGASTKEIAERIGLQQGSLYYYFPSKEAALEQVCERSITEVLARLSAILGTDLTAVKKVENWVEAHMSPIGQMPDFSIVFLRDRRLLPAKARHRIGKMARKYEALVQELFELGVREGVFKRDLDCRLQALISLSLLNASTLWFPAHTEYSLATLIRELKRQILRGAAR